MERAPRGVPALETTTTAEILLHRHFDIPSFNPLAGLRRLPKEAFRMVRSVIEHPSIARDLASMTARFATVPFEAPSAYQHFREFIDSSLYQGAGLPRGHGEAVMYGPGFTAIDEYLKWVAEWHEKMGRVPRRSSTRWNIGFMPFHIRQEINRVDYILQEHDKVILSGHSLSGVIDQHVAKIPRFKGRVILVNYATPQQGCMRELIDRLTIMMDPSLEEVVERPVPGYVPFLSVRSRRGDKVVVGDEGLPEESHAIDVDVDAPHTAVPYDLKGLEETTEFLADAA